MRKSSKNSTPEEFEEYVKISLAYEGYTEKNEMFVRALEIIKEQKERLYMLECAMKMIRRTQNDVTSHARLKEIS